VREVRRRRCPIVLITGESGTGRRSSPGTSTSGCTRPNPAPLPVPRINCAALPEQLIESELFGHEKGRSRRQGREEGIFEIAHGGSILLDEIGEMRLALQAKLLRVIEERKVRRIGGRQDIPINATVIATTNRNLEEAVENGEFRMDLYYRLNAFSFTCRRFGSARATFHCLPAAFSRTIRRSTRRCRSRRSPRGGGVAGRLSVAGEHPELRNVIERVVVLETDAIVRPEHCPRKSCTSRSRPRRSRPRADDPRHGDVAGGGGEEPDRPGAREIEAEQDAGGEASRITYDSLRYQVKKFGLE